MKDRDGYDPQYNMDQACNFVKTRKWLSTQNYEQSFTVFYGTRILFF